MSAARDWVDAVMGEVSISTSTQQAGGNAGNATKALAYIATERPSEWVVRVAPPTQQGSGGQVNPAGFLLVTEGAGGSRLERLARYSALGTAIQVRGQEMYVTVLQAENGTAAALGCTVSPGTVSQRWQPVGGGQLAGAAALEVTLPQFAMLVRVSVSQAPSTSLRVVLEDSVGGLLQTITLLANSSTELPLPPLCTRLQIINNDAINALTFSVSALICE